MTPLNGPRVGSSQRHQKQRDTEPTKNRCRLPLTYKMFPHSEEVAISLEERRLVQSKKKKCSATMRIGMGGLTSNYSTEVLRVGRSCPDPRNNKKVKRYIWEKISQKKTKTGGAFGKK